MEDWSLFPPCTRSPNAMVDVVSFLESFADSSHERNRTSHKLFLTPSGSVNDDGLEESFSAPSLSPHNPQFQDSLEKDIAPLVICLSNRGYIPYTSCEGHSINGKIYEAHVGLLVSDPKYMRKHVDLSKRLHAVSIHFMRHILVDSKHGRQFQTLELYILRDINQSYLSYRSHVRMTVEDAAREV